VVSARSVAEGGAGRSRRRRDQIGFDPAEELIATASRDYFVRVYDFEARLVAKYDGLIGSSPRTWEWGGSGRHAAVLK
jgi:hypothetical protein